MRSSNSVWVFLSSKLCATTCDFGYGVGFQFIRSSAVRREGGKPVPSSIQRKRHAFELEMRIEMDDAVNMRLRRWTEKL